ncbi:hypothetical protein D3C85_1928800 [compost metagenome]
MRTMGDVGKQHVDEVLAEADFLSQYGFFLERCFELSLDGVHGRTSISKRYAFTYQFLKYYMVRYRV